MQEKYTTYERTGHFECPEAQGTSMIYTGFTAGFEAPTGSTTYKCLPTESKYIAYFNDSFSEFQNASEVHFLNLTEYNTFRKPHDHHDVPRAL